MIIRQAKVTTDKGIAMSGRGKTIHVSDEVHKRLAELGKFKDSYNDIIKRLLDATKIDHSDVNGAQEGDGNGQEESSE
jgi:predicted CopG family antitoxin